MKQIGDGGYSVNSSGIVLNLTYNHSSSLVFKKSVNLTPYKEIRVTWILNTAVLGSSSFARCYLVKYDLSTKGRVGTIRGTSEDYYNDWIGKDLISEFDITSLTGHNFLSVYHLVNRDNTMAKGYIKKIEFLV